MQINPVIFREYDIRGTVDKELSDEFARLLGRAYATLAKENGLNRIGVGHDCRLSSPGYAQALAEGLADEGLDVVLTGMGPTPQLYYAVFANDLGGGIQVTGSHNPPDMNGFKILLGKQTLSGSDIQDLKARCQNVLNTTPSGKRGAISSLEVRQSYINYIIDNCKAQIGPRKLKVVVDAGNGVGGLVGPEVLRGLGVEVIELYCDPDGRFPNHHPDPTELKNIKDLVKAVKDHKADFGIGWDGDADRIGVVDEKGEAVFGDMLLLIYGRSILREKPGATIIGDVKCSSQLFDDLKARGANAIMWKTGHSLIKAKLKETHGDLAGEMSGHIFFKHRFFGFDDALYSSARLIEIMSNHQGDFSSLLSGLKPMVSTPEMRVDCPEAIKFKIASEAQNAFKEFKVDTIDGVRVTFDRGWGLVRASNTQPVLVMRFEAESPELLEVYRKTVVDRIENIKASL
ncbi:MAG: phosphomannomutase/phosphoglucomutase [Pseudomonadota bacterium]